MGRPRKHFPKDVDKTLNCKTCGKPHKVSGDAVEVQCEICMMGYAPVGPMTDTLDQFLEKAKANVKGKRGRPAKEEKIVEVTSTEEVKPKRGRGRPRKSALPIEKKGKAMDKVEKKVDVKGGTGKRGRKATVGSAVLGYIKGQGGDVKFNDILNVYTQEREKLGKKATPEIESRNCHSTLYVMVRDGKIREVTKKSVYAAL